MMLKIQLFLCTTVLVVSGCNRSDATTPEQAPSKVVQPAKETPRQQAPAQEPTRTTKLYGEALPAELPVLDLASLLKDPDQYAGKPALISGHVRQACTKKGCWMELASTPEDKGQGCRVTFKDYGFFVPLDSAGSSAKLAGTASLKTVSKDHVDHLESEGATFVNKKEDGTATEIQLVATGVEITR